MSKVANNKNKGFTLIELSIVLVIIGLIVGGVLVGRDLIKAAELRAQITQNEQTMTAIYTFKEKFGALPGDIRDPDATQLGFVARGQYAGEGDGNGLLQGVVTHAADQNCGISYIGENLLIWNDLSMAGLINANTRSAVATSTTAIFGNAMESYLPLSKIDGRAFLYTYSDRGVNYLAVSRIASIVGSSMTHILGAAAPAVAFSVAQAYGIDTKLDDGMPYTGRITVHAPRYASTGCVAAANIPRVYLLNNTTNYTNWGTGDTPGIQNAPRAAYPASVTTCWDNNNVASDPPAPLQYSLSQSGDGPKCSLSFKF